MLSGNIFKAKIAYVPAAVSPFLFCGVTLGQQGNPDSAVVRSILTTVKEPRFRQKAASSDEKL